MAVYTHVDKTQIEAFLESYDLGMYRDHRGITQGVENTNYHLWTDRGRYILTIFEKRINPADLPFVFGFVAHLGAAGITVPDTYASKAGTLVGTLVGKPAAIIRFLEGSGVADADVDANKCAQLGETLARMHMAAKSFAPVRQNPVGIAQWRALLDAAIPATDMLQPDHLAAIDATLAEYAALDVANLPRGAVHADLFPDNAFFDGARMSGVIDFYFACTDTYVYDLAMTINAWCFGVDGVLRPDRLAAFASAYESVRPLSDAERTAFPVLRRAAALRILSTRLYDWVNTPATAQIVRKDPLEYARKLVAVCAW